MGSRTPSSWPGPAPRAALLEDMDLGLSGEPANVLDRSQTIVLPSVALTLSHDFSIRCDESPAPPEANDSGTVDLELRLSHLSLRS